jgi:hypothetical protein
VKPLSRRFNRNVLVAAVAAVATVAALASSASAATPFSVGTGIYPSLYVDQTGAANVTWVEDSNAGPIHFCRVPEGATSCATQSTIARPGGSTGYRAFVYGGSTPGTLMVVSLSLTPGDARVYRSTDNGATWSGPTVIASGVDYSFASQAAVGPGGNMSLLGGDFNDTYQAASLTLGVPDTTFAHWSGTPYNLDRTVGVSTGTPPVPVWVGRDLAGNMAVFRYDNTKPTDHTSLNMIGNWFGPAAFDQGDQPRLAGGPAGLWLANLTANDDNVVLRKYNDDGTFGSTQTIAPAGGKKDLAFSQDTGGQLDTIWRDTTSGQWQYAHSSPSGVTTPSAFINDSGLHDPVVGTRPDGGKGWAAFDSASASVGAITLSTLDPLPAPPPSGGGGGGGNTGGGNTAGGGGTPGGGGGGQPPAVYNGPNKTTSTTVGGTQIQFSTPKACVAPDTKYKVSVTSKTKIRLAHGHGRVRIKQVTFEVDGKQRSVDRRKAFTALQSTAGMTGGSRHKLTARVVLVGLRGSKKAKAKTLKATLSVC